MFIIFIAVFGYKVIISGRFSAPDLVVNTLKIIVILSIATEWDTFFLLVYNLVTEMPSDLGGQIMQGAANAFSAPVANDAITANSALADYFDRSMAVSETILQAAGWTDFGLYFYVFLIWVGTLLFTGYAAMLIILSKIAVAVLLAVAPIFILLLIFANTRNLFEGWLRTLLNFALIPIFVYALLALSLTLAEAPLQFLEANSDPDKSLMASVGAFVFTSFVFFMVLAQVMNMAASITGSLSLSSLGMGGAIGRIGSGMLRQSPRKAFVGGVFGTNAARYPVKTAQAARARLSTTIKNIRGF